LRPQRWADIKPARTALSACPSTNTDSYSVAVKTHQVSFCTGACVEKYVWFPALYDAQLSKSPCL
jgi:hypothetical protein